MMIEASHAAISIRRQCDLIGLNRSTLYYHPAGESALNLELMRLIDEQYTKTPFYGWPRMTAQLQRLGYEVNHKRVQRLMQLMGLQAVYPKPRTTVPGKEHKIYPYLLRDLEISRPNHVWAADITYIRMHQGFMYLVAIMDWATRKVLSWRLSNTLDADFCVEALREALSRFPTPKIFNTDQGSQFTSEDFTGVLRDRGIRISMDGKGRFLDNIFVERLWRSLKYEEVYLKAYDSLTEARAGIGAYFEFFNHDRPHSALGHQTPAAFYDSTAALAA
jgi:putative transposase